MFGASAEAAKECHVLRLAASRNPSTVSTCSSARSCSMLRAEGGLAPPDFPPTRSIRSSVPRSNKPGTPPLVDRKDYTAPTERTASTSGSSSPMSVESRGPEQRGACTGSTGVYPGVGAPAQLVDSPPIDAVDAFRDDIRQSWRRWMPKSMPPRKFAIAVRRKVAAALQQGILWRTKKVRAVHSAISSRKESAVGRRGTGAGDWIQTVSRRTVPGWGHAGAGKGETTQTSTEAVSDRGLSNSGDRGDGERKSLLMPATAPSKPLAASRGRYKAGMVGIIGSSPGFSGATTRMSVESDGMYDALLRGSGRGLGVCAVLVGMRPSVAAQWSEEVSKCCAAGAGGAGGSGGAASGGGGASGGVKGGGSSGWGGSRGLGFGVRGNVGGAGAKLGRHRSATRIVGKWYGEGVEGVSAAVAAGRRAARTGPQRTRRGTARGGLWRPTGGGRGAGGREVAARLFRAAVSKGASEGVTSGSRSRPGGAGMGDTISAEAGGGGAGGAAKGSESASGGVDRGEWWSRLPCGRCLERVSVTSGQCGMGGAGAGAGTRQGPGDYSEEETMVWAELRPVMQGFRLSKRDVTALEAALRGLERRGKVVSEAVAAE